MIRFDPSTDGANGNGRDAQGRFAPGNRCGKGNPHALEAARFREALLRGVTVEDIEAIVKALVKRAKGGDIPACKEILDRLLGRAPLAVALEMTNPNEQVIRLEYVNDWRNAGGGS